MQPAGRIPPEAWMTSPAAHAVLAALAAGGYGARFVGGCVRDAAIGRPVKDIDIATPAPPDEVMRLLRAAGLKAIPTGIAHGTVTAVAQSAHFEITTLRHDVETFGRRARVAFTDDWAADAARRDFTVNALFCDPDGTLYDPTGGLPDLRAGRVRFVGAPEQRMREDLLRLLRFFRFQAHYGRVPPDPAALAACRKLAPELRTLSAERVWAELRRILLAPDPAAALALMDEQGVLAHVLPEATLLPRLAGLVRLEPQAGAEPEALLRLAAAIDAADGEPVARVLARRLRLSNSERQQLGALLSRADAPVPALDGHGRRVLLYRQGAALFARRALLGWAGAQAAGAADAAGWTSLRDDAARWNPPHFPLAGADALALGVPRGPRIGALLAQAEGWWIDGDFRAGREECLAKLAALARADACGA